MVGELSPDGNFEWNGTAWEAIGNTEPQPTTDHIFQLNPQTDDGLVDWNPVSEKSEEGGKGKIIAMSIVGLLLVSAMGWVLYTFVIDGMLFPDELSKDEFIKIAGDETSLEDVRAGDIDNWGCNIEYTLTAELEGDSMTIKADYEFHASQDSARAKTEMRIYFTEYGNDIWIDENKIAWDIIDGETGQIAIEEFNSTPAKELFNETYSTEMDWCFAHNIVAENLTNNPSQMFKSEGERFPDEDGERAVKIETMQKLGPENEEFTISIYFDEDDTLLGSKISNSTFDCLVIIDSKSFSEPGWVKNADADTPMLLSLDMEWIDDPSQTTFVKTQYNATYSMEGAEVVLYTRVYDEDYNYTYVVDYSVDIETAINGGGIISHTDEYEGENNCTLSYDDRNKVGISSGDLVSISCDNYAMTGFYLGLANSNGVAEEKDLAMPWISPIFTIMSLLGAALIVSRNRR
jgi:hypothetical protein